MSSIDALVDVCVFCALHEEAIAVIDIFTRHAKARFERKYQADIGTYHAALLHNANDEPLTVHVTWAVEQGPTATLLALPRVFAAWRPRFAAMTGICAGDRRRVSLGDLVIASLAYSYDEGGKWADSHDDDGTAIYSANTATWHANQNLIQFAQDFNEWKDAAKALGRPLSRRHRTDWLLDRLLQTSSFCIDDLPAEELELHVPGEHLRKIIAELQGGSRSVLTAGRKLRSPKQVRALRHERAFPFRDPEEPRSHVAPLASGSSVRADDPFREIQKPVRKTVAIDMEGASFYRTLASFPDIPGLVVKGVCDYADREKDDGFHRYAAELSALYLLCFIQGSVTDERIPRKSTGASLPSRGRSSGESPSKVEAHVTTITTSKEPAGPRHDPEVIPEPAALPPHSRMPFGRNPSFVGREDSMRVLAKTFLAERPTGGQAIAVIGQAGVGKTQLACEFVHRYGQYFTGGVFWLNFAEPKLIPAEIAACAGGLNVPGLQGLSLEDRIARVQQEWQRATPRLLVFENCEEESPFQQWRPTTGGCQVLITSRWTRWSTSLGVKVLTLDKLARGESIALLKRYRPDLSESDSALGAIAEEIDDLPLVLHLAGSFLETFRHDAVLGQPENYLDDLRNARVLDHPSLQGEDVTQAPTGHVLHVNKTFALSFDRLNRQNPIDDGAARLLARAACCAPGQPILRELLIKSLGGDQQNHHGRRAMTRLVDLGLLEGNGERVRIHRLMKMFVESVSEMDEAFGGIAWALVEYMDDLVQTSTKDHQLLLSLQPHLGAVTGRALELWESRWDGWVTATINKVISGGPEALGDDGATRIFVPGESNPHVNEEERVHLEHVRRVHALTLPIFRLPESMADLLRILGDLKGEKENLERALSLREAVLGKVPGAGGILQKLGSVCHALANYKEAREHLDRALSLDRQEYGEESARVARDLSELGRLLHTLGDLQQAKACFEQALGINRRIGDEKDSGISSVLSNLGMLLLDQGDLDGARAHFEESLVIAGERSEKSRPDSVATLNNLGLLFHKRNDLPSARAYYERALAAHEHALDQRDPELLSTILGNIGMVVIDQGDLDQGRGHLERALEIRERLLGEDHPDVALTIHNLAAVLHRQGDKAGAKRYLERALSIWLQSVGEWHHHTATTLSMLGSLLEEEGAADEARRCRERAAAIYDRAGQHGDGIEALKARVVLLRVQGDTPAARECFQKALDTARRVFGEQHVATADCLNKLGRLSQDQGALEEARDYFERALAIYDQVPDGGGLDVAMVLNNLAGVLLVEGDLAAARSHYERALPMVEQFLGSRHEHTEMILQKLGKVSQAQGDLVGAQKYLEQLQVIYERTRGNLHADTAENLFFLGMILHRLRDLEGARRRLEQALAIDEQLKGGQDPDFASSLFGLALVLVEQGDLDKAIECTERSLAIFEKCRGAEDETAQRVRQFHSLVSAKRAKSD